MKEKIIKYGYYIVLLLIVLLTILNTKLDNMDELWNFSNAKNIIDGLVPYRDINIIVTPLSQYLNSILLRISPILITFRIIYFFYYVIIIILLDRILDTINIKGLLKYLFILFFIIMLVKICFLDYNFIQFIMILMLLYLHIKNRNYNNKKINIIIPLISGLSIINKQSTGVIICGVNILILLIDKYCYKKNIRNKYIFKQIYLSLIPILLFMIYLLVFDIVGDFYDLAIAGLTTFSNKYIDYKLLLFVIILLLLVNKYLIIYRDDKNYWIIYIYMITSLFFIIPIMDMAHVIFSLLLLFLCIVKVVNDNIRNISGIYILMLFPFLIFIIINKFNIYRDGLKMDYGIYKDIMIDINLKNDMLVIDDYILKNNKQVYILDFTSTLYDLNINRYYKYFDLFMNGNFGINGIDNMKKIIDNKEQVILIRNNDYNYQIPIDIVDYVKSNYKYCGNISLFDIYCN